MEVTDFTSKNIHKFCCENCDFKCSKIGDWNRHIMTLKHKTVTAGDNFTSITSSHVCENCSKKYKSRNGLWKHKQSCNNEKMIQICEINEPNLMNIVLEVIKQNKELIQQNNEKQKQNDELTNKLVDLCKNTVSTTNIVNSNNKIFNLNVFLNETCKDAMNITDFVDSLKIQLSDLENVGEVGFINGISNIIVKNLKSLDITQRPVHCTDAKREVLYVKDKNKWEKEDEENMKLRQAIKRVAYKNTKLLSAFREKYPDCNKSESKYSDQYNKLIIEAMGGKGDNDKDKETKIIKNIAKEVIIDK
jgi:hypothetical protein